MDAIIIQSLQNIQRLFSQHKSLNMTSFNVTNFRNAIFRLSRRFCACYILAKVVSFVTVQTARGSVRTPTSIWRSVWTPQQTPTTGNTCSHYNPESPADTWTQEHMFDAESEQRCDGCEQWKRHATARTLGQGRLDAMTEN